MEPKNEIVQIVSEGMEVFEAQERAAIDIQVATAKKYPRNLLRTKQNSITIATMNKETAESCRYAKPIGNKKIYSGPSVHLARIICQQYGNIRIAKRIKQITDKTIIAEAIAFDMETNYAVCVEARRSIIDKEGRRYSDSLIETNAMAVMAIAERNAIYQVVPKSLVDEVYDEAFKFANGDLSDNAKFLQAREKAFEFFKTNYDANEMEVLASLGLKSKEAMKQEHIATLRGYMQALKEKEIDSDELFERNKSRKPDKDIKMQKDPEISKEPQQMNI